GEGLQSLIPARSRRSDLVHLLATLEAIQPAGTTGLAAGMHEVLARIPHRGVLVVMSDLLTQTEALLAALHHARYRGHDLIVMHILDAAEAELGFEGALVLEDPETGERIEVDADGVRERYRRAIDEWRADLKRRIEALRGDYVALHTAMPFDKAL